MLMYADPDPDNSAEGEEVGMKIKRQEWTEENLCSGEKSSLSQLHCTVVVRFIFQFHCLVKLKQCF